MNHFFGVNADYADGDYLLRWVANFPCPKVTPLGVEPLKLTHNPAPPSLLPEFPFSAVETAILSCLII